MRESEEHSFDSLIEQQLEKVSIRFNADHWEQLQDQLAASGTADSVNSNWLHSKPVSVSKLIWGVSIVLAVVILFSLGILFFSDQNPKEGIGTETTPDIEEVIPLESTTPVLPINKKGLHEPGLESTITIPTKGVAKTPEEPPLNELQEPVQKALHQNDKDTTVLDSTSKPMDDSTAKSLKIFW